MLDYTLAVLTHGRSRTLDATLRSFTDKVKPHPARVLIHSDGPRSVELQARGLTAEQRFDSQQRGFCQATGRLWNWASEPDIETTEFVFWLEHDFVFLRPVDLTDLATVLNDDKSLAQMSLMRGPVSTEEINAGGLYNLRRGDFDPIISYDLDISEEPMHWLQHRAYFTTNPSLMRTAWMSANPWPTDESHCEGRFGIDLLQRGFSFGVWGGGEPWIDHTGRRDGFGY